MKILWLGMALSRTAISSSNVSAVATIAVEGVHNWLVFVGLVDAAEARRHQDLREGGMCLRRTKEVNPMLCYAVTQYSDSSWLTP